MALVGVIKAGTVSSICRSISQTKGDVLLLLEREQQVGHLVFEKGELVDATLGALTGSDALRTVERWSTGMYSLIKRSTDSGAPARAQVLVVGIDLETRKSYESWLEEHGFATNVVTDNKQALQVASFLNPDVVIMGCPKLGQKTTCEELREQMAQKTGAPPLVVTIAELEQRCEDPNILCQVKPLSLEQMDELLSKRWPNTLFGQRQELERQLVQRISSDQATLLAPPQGDPASLDLDEDAEEEEDEVDTNPELFPGPEISDEITTEIETPQPKPAEPPEDEEAADPTPAGVLEELQLPSVDVDEDYPAEVVTDETTTVVTKVAKLKPILIAAGVLLLAGGVVLLVFLLR